MEGLLFLLPALGCGLMMVACMYLMGRGMRGGEQGEQPEAAADRDEVAGLRKEVARLRAEREGEQAHASRSATRPARPRTQRRSARQPNGRQPTLDSGRTRRRSSASRMELSSAGAGSDSPQRRAALAALVPTTWFHSLSSACPILATGSLLRRGRRRQGSRWASRWHSRWRPVEGDSTGTGGRGRPVGVPVSRPRSQWRPGKREATGTSAMAAHFVRRRRSGACLRGQRPSQSHHRSPR